MVLLTILGIAASAFFVYENYDNKEENKKEPVQQEQVIEEDSDQKSE